MTVFLLIVSFIVDGILIFAIFTMMNKVKRAEELELRQKQVATEIEDLFTSYLMEIKEENNRMNEWLSTSKVRKGHEERMKPVPPIEEEPKESPEESDRPSAYMPPQPEEAPNDYQPSIHSQVFDLKRKGYTIEEIAKKLDKGKTEIELLYKFHQKNS